MDLADLIREVRTHDKQCGDADDHSPSESTEPGKLSRKGSISSSGKPDSCGGSSGDKAEGGSDGQDSSDEKRIGADVVQSTATLQAASRRKRLELKAASNKRQGGIDTQDGGDGELSRADANEIKDVLAMQAESRAKRMMTRACGISPVDLCGNWTDSFGNTVCVYSSDAWSPQLTATLSSPPRHDINLPVSRVPGGHGWRCGGALLDSGSPTELRWRFPDGRTSVWKRQPGQMVPTVMVPAPACNADPRFPEVFYCWLPVDPVGPAPPAAAQR